MKNVRYYFVGMVIKIFNDYVGVVYLFGVGLLLQWWARPLWKIWLKYALLSADSSLINSASILLSDFPIFLSCHGFTWRIYVILVADHKCQQLKLPLTWNENCLICFNFLFLTINFFWFLLNKELSTKRSTKFLFWI